MGIIILNDINSDSLKSVEISFYVCVESYIFFFLFFSFFFLRWQEKLTSADKFLDTGFFLHYACTVDPGAGILVVLTSC